ncbi:hypothetical protein RCL1_005559 [Eukaryota sp. TZLM3-RCL]
MNELAKLNLLSTFLEQELVVKNLRSIIAQLISALKQQDRSSITTLNNRIETQQELIDVLNSSLSVQEALLSKQKHIISSLSSKIEHPKVAPNDAARLLDEPFNLEIDKSFLIDCSSLYSVDIVFAKFLNSLTPPTSFLSFLSCIVDLFSFFHLFKNVPNQSSTFLTESQQFFSFCSDFSHYLFLDFQSLESKIFTNSTIDHLWNEIISRNFNIHLKFCELVPSSCDLFLSLFKCIVLLNEIEASSVFKYLSKISMVCKLFSISPLDSVQFNCDLKQEQSFFNQQLSTTLLESKIDGILDHVFHQLSIISTSPPVHIDVDEYKNEIKALNMENDTLRQLVGFLKVKAKIPETEVEDNGFVGLSESLVRPLKIRPKISNHPSVEMIVNSKFSNELRLSLARSLVKPIE